MARSLLLVLSTMRARSSLPCFGALDLQGSLIHLDKPVRIGWLDRDSGNAHFAWLSPTLARSLVVGTLLLFGSLIVRWYSQIRWPAPSFWYARNEWLALGLWYRSHFVARSHYWVLSWHPARSQCRVRSANLARSHVMVPSYRVAHSSVLVRSGPLARSQGVARSVDWARSHILAPSMRMARSNSFGATLRGWLARRRWCALPEMARSLILVPSWKMARSLEMVRSRLLARSIRLVPSHGLASRHHYPLHVRLDPPRVLQPMLILSRSAGPFLRRDAGLCTQKADSQLALAMPRLARGRSADSDTGGPGQKGHSSSSVG